MKLQTGEEDNGSLRIDVYNNEGTLVHWRFRIDQDTGNITLLAGTTTNGKPAAFNLHHTSIDKISLVMHPMQ